MHKSGTSVWQTTSLFKITVLSSALATFGITTGCSSTPKSTTISTSKSVKSDYLDASSLDSLEDLLSATDMRAVEGDRLMVLKYGDVWKRMTVGFKMDLNHWDPRIEAQRSWFISRQPYLDRLSARASRYLYHTVKEAERRGLPTELALLPVIESSYDPAATSSAAATGLWQFIPSTGRIYGLQQTSLYDGRRDVVESTRAAYEFLGSLYNQFGSWELALAAYNAGPGRIQQAINRNKAAGLPTDYWSLKLPKETMNYVPRFLAVAQIIKNPHAYGVDLPPIANRPHFREVSLSSPLKLDQVASITGLSRTELYALNPAYRGEMVDPTSPMRILIPADLSPTIDAKLRAGKASSGGFWAHLKPSSDRNKADATVKITTTTRPTSSSENSSVTTASSTTSPSSSTVVQGGQTVTPKGADALASFAATANVPSAPRIPVAITPAANIKPVTVEPPISAKEREQITAAIQEENKQETINQVLEPEVTQAEKDQVVAEIKAIAPQGTEIVDPFDGKIKLTAIQTSQSVADEKGQEVTKGFAYPKTLAEDPIVANSDEAKRNQGKPYIKTDTDVVVTPPKGKRSNYTVLPGDTLAIIAQKNGVNWRDIAKWNQIDPNSTLFVGTSLYLYDAKPQVVTSNNTNKPESYVVQPNDSLIAVAQQFDLSVSQLAEYNDLAVNANLLVGQKLRLTAPQNAEKQTVKKVVEKTQERSTKIATKSYTVQRGEYLKLIAERYALSNQELADLTPNLKANSELLVGQKINVPLERVDTDSSSPSEPVTTVASNNNDTENYIVKGGETLLGIATRSKMSLSELARLNGLNTNSQVRVGQRLKVVTGTTIPESYVVQSGDSLNAIANKYHLKLSYLADLNGLERTEGVHIGQTLKLTGDIPQKATSTELGQREKAPNVAKNSTKATESYIVKSGESLNGLANRFGISGRELADLNGLKANTNLLRGQRILVPKMVVEYKVKSGDTLIGLANRYGLATSALAEMNDVSPQTQLRIGDVIKVPNL